MARVGTPEPLFKAVEHDGQSHLGLRAAVRFHGKKISIYDHVVGPYFNPKPNAAKEKRNQMPLISRVEVGHDRNRQHRAKRKTRLRETKPTAVRDR